MPKGKPLKTRVLGLPKGYKYKEWLDSQLNVDEPFIDYFKFADTFDGSESATNYHYADLLEKLSSGQSNKLTKIASIAKTLYNSRKLNSKFGKRYEEYWKMKNEDIKLQRTMRTQNQQTVLRLKELTIKHIPHFAQMNNNIEVSAEDEFTEDSITQRVMTQTTNLPSTVVGDLKIIDLSLQIAEEMLKAETSAAQFESIMKASKIDLNPMSVQANTLIKGLNDTPLSVQGLRNALYRQGFHDNSDLIVNHDIGFIEVTVRHFLDFMNSPNSPLNTVMLERTATTCLIIFIVNQLFISNNDVIELGWLEREFFSTDRTKFDGIIFKVGNKMIAPGLVEFSGGINDKTSSRKNAKDIEKLYTNMVKVMEDIKTDKMFCMRCFGHNIYFEKLVHYDGVMYRTVDVVVDIPNTPRKLVAYVNQIPSILAWKEALINHALDLN